MRLLLALALLMPAPAFAGAWGLDVGLTAGVGMSRFAGAPSGFRPSGDPNNLFNIYPPDVAATAGTGLAGSGGFELALHRKRRFMATLQVLWQGQSLSMEETLSYPSGVRLNRSMVWEWSGLQLPMELSYCHPLSKGPGWAMLGRVGAGMWYQKNQVWSRRQSGDVLANASQTWNGPPDDWGPLLGLGLDWLALPTGKRVVSFEVRATHGRSQVDPAGGGDQAVWTLGGVLSVPIKMWVL